MEKKFTKSPLYYLPDVADPNHHRIYDNGVIREVKKEECFGLEINGIWSSEQLEERVRDRYSGIENQHLKTLQRYAISKQLVLPKSNIGKK